MDTLRQQQQEKEEMERRDAILEANLIKAESFTHLVELQYGKNTKTYIDFLIMMSEWDAGRMESAEILYDCATYLFREQPFMIVGFKSLYPLKEGQTDGTGVTVKDLFDQNTTACGT